MSSMPNTKTKLIKNSQLSRHFNLLSYSLIYLRSDLFFFWSSVSVALLYLFSFSPRRSDSMSSIIDTNSFACLIRSIHYRELRIKSVAKTVRYVRKSRQVHEKLRVSSSPQNMELYVSIITYVLELY